MVLIIQSAMEIDPDELIWSAKELEEESAERDKAEEEEEEEEEDDIKE